MAENFEVFLAEKATESLVTWAEKIDQSITSSFSASRELVSKLGAH